MIASFVKFILDNLLLIQFISFLISSILLLLTIYFLVNINVIGEEFDHFLGVFTNKDIVKRRNLRGWKQIQKKLKSGEEKELKLAVIEADLILNEILKMIGYSGKNLDERLEQLNREQLSNIEEIKQAHKLKTRLVSEPDFRLTANEVKVIIEIYKKAFQEFNLIE